MKALYRSSSLLLAGLFLANLQACTEMEPAPTTTAQTAQAKSNLSVVTHRYMSNSGVQTSYLPWLYQVSGKATGGPSTSQLYDGDISCVQVYEDVIDVSNGNVISETIIGQYCTESGGSGGGGPADPPTDPGTGPAESNDTGPCPANQNLSYSQTHTTLANLLRNSVTQSQATGYAYAETSAGGLAVQLHPGPNQPEVVIDWPFYPGTTQPAALYGMMSTHTSTMLSIYSVNDLYNFYLVLFGGPGTYDPPTFVSELFTAAGADYTISNPYGSAFFPDFANQYLATPAGRANLQAQYASYGIDSSHTPAQNELNFLKLMKDLRSGLALSTGDGGGGWISLSLDNRNREISNYCIPQ